MKVKKIFIQIMAILICVITLTLSVGEKFCFYNNIGKAHAADPFTLTMGSLALEEIILGIATAVLGYEVAEQYHDDIIDSFKEYAKNPSMITDPQKNLFEAYAGTNYSSYTWEEYEEILQSMGSATKESFEDYKEKFNNVFVRPCKEFIQYISDFYTRLFTDTPQAGDEGYIKGLSEYLDKGSIFENYEIVDGVYNWYFIAYAIGNPSYAICLNEPSSTSKSRKFIVLNNNCLKVYSWIDSAGKSYNGNFGVKCYINDSYEYDRSLSDINLAEYSVTTCNMPIFDSVEAAEEAMLLFDYSSALNYGKSMDAIAIPGDDIPTVGNWEDLWERLKNPDLPWWFCNPDALGLANASDLPWFDVAGLYDWAQDIPSIRDGIIEGNPDIPWTDVWDGVINIPDVIIPAIDFPIVDDPAKPGETTEPTATPLPTPSPGEGIDSTKPVVDLSKFFPFCIPFDLIHLIQALDAEPVAPKWTLKLEPPQFPVEWEVVLDLSDFESLAKIFRTGETLLFVVGLILITRGIIKG